MQVMVGREIESLVTIVITLFLCLIVNVSPAVASVTDATVWNNLGQQLFSQKRYPDALLAYNHALLIEPEYSLVLANRCGVLSQLQEFHQALVSCDLALEINSQWGAQGSALGWDNRGDALFNLERYQDALHSFEQALMHNPGYQNARRNRQIVLNRLEQIGEKP
ncbi:tetratricopeptide repeat protein [Adonisia turfae]|nr:tetratricopeptide repeat protein [Adonisia turfae]